MSAAKRKRSKKVRKADAKPGDVLRSSSKLTYMGGCPMAALLVTARGPEWLNPIVTNDQGGDGWVAEGIFLNPHWFAWSRIEKISPEEVGLSPEQCAGE